MRERMPDVREGVTHRVKIRSSIRKTPVKLFITANYYPEGKGQKEPSRRIGEVFIQVDEKGTELSGACITWGILLSICLQNGVKLEKLHEKLSYQEFEPKGMTDNPEIPFARSVIDYVIRWMAGQKA